MLRGRGFSIYSKSDLVASCFRVSFSLLLRFICTFPFYCVYIGVLGQILNLGLSWFHIMIEKALNVFRCSRKAFIVWDLSVAQSN